MIILTVINLYVRVKIAVMVTVIYGKKYSLPSTKVLGFVSCRVTSKIIGIGYSERSWGDVKTIKSGNRSALGSDIYEN